MVECATREPDSTLSGLLSELNVQQSAEALEYGLPAPAELGALRECMRELLLEPAWLWRDVEGREGLRIISDYVTSQSDDRPKPL